MSKDAGGLKYDGQKERWDLLPWHPLTYVVKVLTYGAQKYAPGNWQRVQDPSARYFAAAQRHLVAWQTGEQVDAESGLPHLAHAICCLLFLHWFDLNPTRISQAEHTCVEDTSIGGVCVSCRKLMESPNQAAFLAAKARNDAFAKRPESHVHTRSKDGYCAICGSSMP